MAFSFIYNKLNSLDEELYIESIPPIPSFSEEDNLYTIVFAYRNSENDNLRKYMRLKKAFSSEGELRLNNAKDIFLRVDKVTFKEIEKNRAYVVNAVTFHLDPFIYFNNGEDVITITSNSYTTYRDLVTVSKPIIKVFGTDRGNLNVNGNSIDINFSGSYIIIDSMRDECYSDTGLLNNDIQTGVFPELIEGTNTITFSGGITKLELIPNWRC